MDFMMRALVSVCLVNLVGCAAVGVLATDDPWQKLGNAQAMIEQNRPGPAERFIVEALAECQKRQDSDCAAAAYREYGLFFLWATPEWNNYYVNFGFKDKAATYDSRYKMSVKYLLLAEELYSQAPKFDAVTNVALNLGFAYQAMSQKTAACHSFDASLEANRENVRVNPNAEIVLPEKYESYESYIAIKKKQAGCAESEAG